MTDIVIVGAGQAGGSAALQLRSAGFGAITLIRADLTPLRRPPLSKPTQVNLHTTLFFCGPPSFTGSRTFNC